MTPAQFQEIATAIETLRAELQAAYRRNELTWHDAAELFAMVGNVRMFVRATGNNLAQGYEDMQRGPD